MSYASLNARLARLEARLTAPDEAQLDRVATMLDDLGARDPEQANELMQSFGMLHRYPPLPPFREDPTDA